MEMSALYRKRSLFSEHNLAPTFLLGMASLSLNLQDLFEQEARHHSLAPSDVSAEDEMKNERYLDFVLGLLVTSRRFNQMIAVEREKVTAAHTESELGETAASSTPVYELRHLLR